MDRDTTAWVFRAIAGIAVVVPLSTALAARGMAAEWRGHLVAAPAPPPSPQSPPPYWYYCPSMNGCYPYVTECPEGWPPVAPQPAPPG